MNRVIHILTTCLLMGVCIQASALWVPEQGGVICTSANEGGFRMRPTGGGPIIWPWGQEMIFPWSGIQGVWQVSGTECSKLYVFRVIRQSGTEKVLDIVNYDPITCAVIASGKGIESNRIVRAVLAGRQGSYELTIHAFDPSVLVNPVVRTRIPNRFAVDPVLVMRVYPLGGRPSPNQTLKLDRVDKNTSMICE